MNKPQKIIALAYATLVSVSIFFAPHHADGKGDAIFCMLGTKTPIPYSANAEARAEIERIYNADKSAFFQGKSLNYFSRQMDHFNRENPRPNDLDFTAGFSGWPVPNYTMLAGFWAVITIFGAVGIAMFKVSK